MEWLRNEGNETRFECSQGMNWWKRKESECGESDEERVLEQIFIANYIKIIYT